MLTKQEFDKLPKEAQDAILKAEQEMKAKLVEDAKNNPLPKQITMAELEGKFTEIVKNHIKPMTEVDKKYFVFPGSDGKDKDNRSPEAKFAKTTKFLNALVKGDVQTATVLHDEVNQKANLNEATGAQGAFLVPEEFKAEILRLAPQYGVVRANARMVPMKSDVTNYPAGGTTDITAHWTNEGSQIYTTNPTVRQVVLTINKLASIPKVTPELLADANVDVIQYLSMLIAEQFAKAEDTQGLIGVGSPFVGCLNATGAPTYPHVGGTGFECLSYQDLVKCPSYTYALNNAKYYFHRSMVGHIHSLITTAGAPIFPANAASVVGYPLVKSEVLPGIGHAAYQTDATTYALFGDLKRGLLMGERGAITMKLLTEGTVLGDNLGEQDMVALRVIERVCFGVALPSAFVVIKS